ncbi:MAG: 4a-hydroxytetrahydrobiopterin dehydratase [Nocardioides sp.]
MTPADPKQTLTFQQVQDAGLDDWRMLFSALHARFRTGDFATGLELVNRIGRDAEELNHHPDLDLRYPHLNVRLTSHDVGGVSSRDLELARRTSAYATDLGASADPSAVSVLEIGLDTADADAIRPFWRAVLGLTDSTLADGELGDGDGALPTLWFQQTQPHDEPRQRFHLDVRVPAEEAAGRIAAALAAGGVLVSDERAPRCTVLADAQGNKACVTTGLGRD